MVTSNVKEESFVCSISGVVSGTSGVTMGVKVSVGVGVNVKVTVGVSVGGGVGGAEVGISEGVDVGAKVAVGIAVGVSASVAVGIGDGGTSVGMISPDCARAVPNPALISTVRLRYNANRDFKNHMVSGFESAYARISR